MNDSTTGDEAQRIAVLGLGPMGAALCRSLAAAGHEVRAWNRSPREVPAPVRLCATPEAAVAGADVVLICVRDHDASRTLVDRVAPALRPGAPVVNLSSGTSAQAVESARSAEALGVGYVTGAIMVPTALIGTEDNLVLYAGEPATVAAAQPALDALGGVVDVLGPDHALPPVLDMAMLDIFFAGMYAYLHSAAMVRAHGVEPSAYLPYARGILGALDGELDSLTRSYERRRYDGGQASLGMCQSFLKHILATSEESGVDPRLPRLLRDVTREQGDRSGDEIDWDVVAEGLTRT